MAQTYGTSTVDSKVQASKSEASDSQNPKTSTHPRSKRSLHKPFFPMSRRFLLLRAFPLSSSRCQPSSGHDVRENDANSSHRSAVVVVKVEIRSEECLTQLFQGT